MEQQGEVAALEKVAVGDDDSAAVQACIAVPCTLVAAETGSIAAFVAVAEQSSGIRERRSAM